MSYYDGEYNKEGATVFSRLEVLEIVRDSGITGIGEFYHNALKGLLSRLPNYTSRADRVAVDAAARIIAQGLAAENYIDAAQDLWFMAQSFDVIRDYNDGLVMQDALIALGEIGATNFVHHIALRLDNFNTDQTSDVETRRRIQRGVVGAINALEKLKDPEAFRPIFFASIGWYDVSIRAMASAALPNIMEDPGDIISAIIRDSSITPRAKNEAWREMLRTRAPNESKARVAAVALATGWNHSTSNLEFQRNLREMRMSAMETIRLMGAADSSVYTNLERSYRNNYVSTSPDFDEIGRAINTLSALQTEEGAALLLQFLRELHSRRRFGPWGAKERAVLQLLIPALGASGSQSSDVRAHLTSIQRSSDYTSAEQNWAREALRALGY